MRENMQLLAFWTWLTSLKMMFSSSIHLPEYSSVIDHLPNTHKVQGSILSNTSNNNNNDDNDIYLDSSNFNSLRIHFAEVFYH
jgi:hypothetical protein